MIKVQTNPTQRHAICQRPKLQKEIDGVNYSAVCQLPRRGCSELSRQDRDARTAQLPQKGRVPPHSFATIPSSKQDWKHRPRETDG